MSETNDPAQAPLHGSAQAEQAIRDLQEAAATDPALAAEVRQVFEALNGALLDPSGPSPE